MQLAALEVGDDPASWSAAGFTVDADEVTIGAVRILCRADGGGHDRWQLRADVDAGVPGDVDGIATSPAGGPPHAAVVHPNRVVGFDHVVLRSPDLDRTTEALGALGLDLRRVRDVGEGERAFQQRFFRLGEVILELVGPPRPTDDGPCRIWGYALVSDDLDGSAEILGDRCSEPKDAVQPGRRIATVRTRELGIGPTIALMAPTVLGRPARDDGALNGPVA